MTFEKEEDVTRVTLVSVERQQRRLRTMEDDLEIFLEVTRRWGTIRNLVDEINTTRWLLGMPKFGDDMSDKVDGRDKY